MIINSLSTAGHGMKAKVMPWVLPALIFIAGSCGNPWMKKLTNPLFDEKKPEPQPVTPYPVVPEIILTVDGSHLLAAAIQTVNDGGGGKTWVINVSGSHTLDGTSSERFTTSGDTVFLGGGGTITTDAGGSLFVLGNNDKLILRDITLEGKGANTAPVAFVKNGSELVMQNGSRITGNINTAIPSGGGVYVESGGGVVAGGSGRSFTMNGGTISGNTASLKGGGVFATNGNTFTLVGGDIYAGNNAPMGKVFYAVTGSTLQDGSLSPITLPGTYGATGTYTDAALP
jgi:hypothetical protein